MENLRCSKACHGFERQSRLFHPPLCHLAKAARMDLLSVCTYRLTHGHSPLQFGQPATSRMVALLNLIKAATPARPRMASCVKRPWTYRLFNGPEGCPPLAPWNRQTLHPFIAGARHWHLVRFDCAEHCRAFGKTQLSFMG